MYLLKQPWPSGQGGGILTVLQFFLLLRPVRNCKL